jgi:hypothetical protein
MGQMNPDSLACVGALGCTESTTGASLSTTWNDPQASIAASSSGSTNVAAPISASTNAQITSDGHLGDVDETGGANWESSYRPSISIAGYSFAPPLVSLLFNPGGLEGSANVFAWQQNLIAGFSSSTLTEIFFAVNLVGQTGTGFFALDPVTGQIVLSLTPGVSGYLSAYSIVGINANYFSTVSLLDYVFQTDPITHLLSVTESANTLGLLLPAMGADPSFSMCQPFTLDLSAPDIATLGSSVVTTHLDASGMLTNTNTNATPEPGTFSLFGIAAVLLLTRAARQHRPSH